ncbi:BQ2448_7089 [Microbotryum intermedium]|uniref:BQ2448_7089 protein n=1 Tax=Microbotryum intermedium TaxID=269621 RepID=A0A238FMQ8_9BASI|nr:BQ2448_7089 [Microbotryum intermedium]
MSLARSFAHRLDGQTGPLSGYRKGELKEIASAMDSGIDTTVIRLELENHIRQALREKESLRTNKQFKGLWEALPESEQNIEVNTLGEAASQAVAAIKSISRTPKKSLSKLASNVSTPAEQVLTSVEKQVKSVEKQAKTLVPSKETPARLKKSASNTVTVYSRKSSSNLREAALQAREAVAATQEIASSAWTITSAFGPHEWLTRSTTPAFVVRYPDVSVLTHPTFTHAFLKWSFFTILLPLIASVVLAFPQNSKHTSGRSGRRTANQDDLSAPNALSFALVRTSIVLLNGYIFARAVSNVHWSFEAVEGYPAVSLLASALSAVFAAYEQK